MRFPQQFRNPHLCSMCKDVLITGVTVKDQMRRAKELFEKEIIPRNLEFDRKKREGKLSKELKDALRTNA